MYIHKTIRILDDHLRNEREGGRVTYIVVKEISIRNLNYKMICSNRTFPSYPSKLWPGRRHNGLWWHRHRPSRRTSTSKWQFFCDLLTQLLHRSRTRSRGRWRIRRWCHFLGSWWGGRTCGCRKVAGCSRGGSTNRCWRRSRSEAASPATASTTISTTTALKRRWRSWGALVRARFWRSPATTTARHCYLAVTLLQRERERERGKGVRRAFFLTRE